MSPKDKTVVLAYVIDKLKKQTYDNELLKLDSVVMPDELVRLIAPNH